MVNHDLIRHLAIALRQIPLKAIHVGHFCFQVHDALVLAVFLFSRPAQAFAAVMLSPWGIVRETLAVFIILLTVHAAFCEIKHALKPVTAWLRAKVKTLGHG